MIKFLILTILIAAALGLGVLFLRGAKPPSGPTQPIPTFSPTSTPTPEETTNPSFSPSQSPASQSATLNYAPGTQDKDLSRVTNPQTLSPEDASAKQNITASLDGNDNLINETSSYKIEYVNPPNVFMIEILDNNADGAKDASQSWLESKGISAQGICNLPVKFYLGPGPRDYYQQNNLEFDPTPKGC